MMGLTDAKVCRFSAPVRGQKTYRDDVISGYGVRVSEGGTKTFVLIRGFDCQIVSIGGYPTISLGDVQTEASEFGGLFAKMR